MKLRKDPIALHQDVTTMRQKGRAGHSELMTETRTGPIALLQGTTEMLQTDPASLPVKERQGVTTMRLKDRVGHSARHPVRKLELMTEPKAGPTALLQDTIETIQIDLAGHSVRERHDSTEMNRTDHAALLSVVNLVMKRSPVRI